MRKLIELNMFELLTVLAFLALFQSALLMYNLLGEYTFNELMR